MVELLSRRVMCHYISCSNVLPPVTDWQGGERDFFRKAGNEP